MNLLVTGSSRAMLLDAPGTPLRAVRLPIPRPHDREVLLRVTACAVCRTDLHIVDGELPAHLLPLVPGHEVVGRVIAAGPEARRFRAGQRVGVPWLGGSCGACAYCRAGRENLCERAVFTGYDRHGGFADHALADERYCHPLPEAYDDVHAAPLLCAGLIGYRAYVLTGDAHRLGLYGFGAAGDMPPEPLDAAILFAPVGELVPQALAATRPGGTVVCAGIHMSDIPTFPYALLWGERCLRSVANLTRADGAAYFRQVAQGEVATTVRVYPLEAANAALDDLRVGRIEGAAVLVPG